MTEKEIIEYIGFSGTYTKSVKKKLNKLIKMKINKTRSMFLINLIQEII